MSDDNVALFPGVKYEQPTVNADGELASFEATLPDNPFKKISDIAKRVGVDPVVEAQHPASVLAIGGDGKSYDVFDVVTGVLDYIDGK